MRHEYGCRHAPPDRSRSMLASLSLMIIFRANTVRRNLSDLSSSAMSCDGGTHAHAHIHIHFHITYTQTRARKQTHARRQPDSDPLTHSTRAPEHICTLQGRVREEKREKEERREEKKTGESNGQEVHGLHTCDFAVAQSFSARSVRQRASVSNDSNSVIRVGSAPECKRGY